MRNTFKNYSTKLIDGQELLFCTFEELVTIVDAKIINDIPLSDFITKRLGSIELPLVKKYPELHLAIFAKTIGTRSLFRYYPLVDFDGNFQRVDIRGVKCEVCNWSGLIGTPLASDIYFGISKEYKAHELMRKAKKYATVTCPQCKAAFNQFAIWLGELP